MGILRIAPEFLYGVALYRLGERITASARRAIAASIIATLAFGVLLHAQVDDRIIVAAAGPMILTLALLAKAGAGGALAAPWMLVAGEASYALYLVHMPIMIAWKGVVAELAGRDSSYRLALLELAALLAVTILSALVLHFVWETPARKWIRRRAETLWPEPRPVQPVTTPGTQPPDF